MKDRARRKLLIAGLAVAVALGVLVVGVVVGASDTTFESPTPTKSRYAKRQERREHKLANLSPRERRERFKRLFGEAERCKDKSFERRTHPAEMLGPRSATDTPTTVLWPVRNGWVAGDCRRITFVWAGGGGVDDEDRSIGKFVIRRQGHWPSARIHGAAIVVPDSGPLKIVNAPLGQEVVTSAQRGQLPFTSKRGITGTLDLSTDTVTLSTGEVIERQHR